MRDEFLNGEVFYTLKEAQVLIEGWRHHYNHIRPHSYLGYKPLAQLASVKEGPFAIATAPSFMPKNPSKNELAPGIKNGG